MPKGRFGIARTSWPVKTSTLAVVPVAGVEQAGKSGSELGAAPAMPAAPASGALGVPPALDAAPTSVEPPVPPLFGARLVEPAPAAIGANAPEDSGAQAATSPQESKHAQAAEKAPSDIGAVVPSEGILGSNEYAQAATFHVTRIAASSGATAVSGLLAGLQ